MFGSQRPSQRIHLGLEKQDAKPTYKRGFGFHPLLCVLDETGEALAEINRPGNAGANDEANHLTVLDAALA